MYIFILNKILNTIGKYYSYIVYSIYFNNILNDFGH